MLEAYSWADPLRELIEQNPAVADFALAWILTKFTEPVSANFTQAKIRVCHNPKVTASTASTFTGPSCAHVSCRP